MKDNGIFDDITTREPGNLDNYDRRWDDFEDWLDEGETLAEDSGLAMPTPIEGLEPRFRAEDMPLPEECRRPDRNEAIVQALLDGYSPDLESLSHVDLCGLVHYMVGTMQAMERETAAAQTQADRWRRQWAAAQAELDMREAA